MYTRVEDCIDLNDKSIKWYNIPGYNGYQVSNNGFVRSLKHFRKYPFGIIIRHRNGLFSLTNSNNKRETIRYKNILELVENDSYSMSYPYDTNEVNYTSRNPKWLVED